MGGGVRGWRT
ncbi:hypothetical protein E2C01_094405 [Portunus trituberculatus]|uniref:Uncharacterized protein n=1 Tax=Portunus trituberculatus TaxID=210409 RepID=A0A5B7JSD0_PORTR|nr:hypothetical protein [Portunus trituberculatus]